MRTERTAPPPTPADAGVLERMLEEAHQILDSPDLDKGPRGAGPAGMLKAKCAILRYKAHPQQSLADARALKEPFYASLALGGIAAILQESDPEQSEKLYTEAEQLALGITHWTGSDATSIGYLYRLIPGYDSQRARRLWERAAPALMKWDKAGDRANDAMRELSVVTVQIAPEKVEEFQQIYITGKHHYFASAEILARAYFEQSPTAAREKLNQWTAKGSSGSDVRALRRAILAEDAARDYPVALAWVKGLKTSDWNRSHDRLIALQDLALILLHTGRSPEAKEVVEYLVQEARIHDEAFHKANNTTGFLDYALSLQKQVEFGVAARGATIAVGDTLDDVREVDFSTVPRFTTTPADVDAFLKEPGARSHIHIHGGIIILERPWITLRDDAQAAQLLAAARPVTEKLTGDGGYHGSPRSTAAGALAIIECTRGNWQRAHDLIKLSGVPALRAYYLLEAYEMAYPLPKAVRGWPLDYWQSPVVTIGKSSSP